MVKKDDGSEVLSWKDRGEAGTAPTTFNDEKAGGIGHWVPEPKDALKGRG